MRKTSQSGNFHARKHFDAAKKFPYRKLYWAGNMSIHATKIYVSAILLRVY